MQAFLAARFEGWARIRPDPPRRQPELEVPFGRPAVLDGPRVAALRAELASMKLTALHKRASADGVGGEALEDAMDDGSPKQAVIALLLQVHASAQAQASTEPARTLEQLRWLRPSELRKMAVAHGALAEQVDEAEDSDNPREALAALVEGCMTS
jgi:hypothetical protein